MSSDEYTPTTEEVRREYAAGRGRMGLAIDLDTHSDFNRWLAQVERAAAERAWDEGWRGREEAERTRYHTTSPEIRNPYREGEARND